MAFGASWRGEKRGCDFEMRTGGCMSKIKNEFECAPKDEPFFHATVMWPRAVHSAVRTH